MNIGLIATPIAYLNYRKKQAAYDEAKAKYEQLVGVADRAIEAYQNELDDIDQLLVGADENGDYAQEHNLPDLKVIARLQVGMLVGKKMMARAILFVKNDSATETYYVSKEMLLRFTAYGKEFNYIGGVHIMGGGMDWKPIRDDRWKNAGLAFCGKYYAIRPGGYIQFETTGTPVEMPLLCKDDMKRLRQDIANMAGKKLVTSVKAGTVFDIPADYNMFTADWGGYRAYIKGNMTIQTQFLKSNDSIQLEYMGDAWYPNTKEVMEIIGAALLEGL